MHILPAESVSLYIDFNSFQSYVFIGCWFIDAQSQFNIISSWLWELFTEPGWIVEVTAAAGGSTAWAIPERILMVELKLCSISTSSVTEVALSYEGWDSSSKVGVCLSTRAHNRTRSSFTMSCYNLNDWSSIHNCHFNHYGSMATGMEDMVFLFL